MRPNIGSILILRSVPVICIHSLDMFGTKTLSPPCTTFNTICHSNQLHDFRTISICWNLPVRDGSLPLNIESRNIDVFMRWISLRMTGGGGTFSTNRHRMSSNPDDEHCYRLRKRVESHPLRPKRATTMSTLTNENPERTNVECFVPEVFTIEPTLARRQRNLVPFFCRTQKACRASNDNHA